MRKRFMRILVFFDLPVLTVNQRKSYRKFRKFLIKDGYIMLQESVYSKLVINQTNLDSAIKKLEKSKPDYGIVQFLSITEKQYSSIDYLIGKANHCQIDSTTRLVIL